MREAKLREKNTPAYIVPKFSGRNWGVGQVIVFTIELVIYQTVEVFSMYPFS